MYQLRLVALLMLLLPARSLWAQKVRSDDIEYKYRRLPAQPLNKSWKNYTATLVPAFEEKNRQMQAAYEADVKRADEKYRKDLEQYALDVKAADARYDKALEEYNKKSTGTKILERSVLGDNGKPLRQVPPQPVKEVVPKPALQKTYDYAALAGTYLRLEGFQNDPAGAVQVIVTMHGFDYTLPLVQTVQRQRIDLARGSTPYQATLYYTEFSYRHPLTLKVLSPTGAELLNVTPPQTNVYKVYKTPESDRIPSVNPELLVATNEEKVLQENLRWVNDYLNDKYGYALVPRKATLYYVKAKGDDYTDLTTAFNEASSGLRLLETDAAAGAAALAKANTAWTAAIAESDAAGGKGRVDKDLRLALAFNLLESYFATANASDASALLARMNGWELDRGDRRKKEEFEALFADLKKRSQN